MLGAPFSRLVVFSLNLPPGRNNGVTSHVIIIALFSLFRTVPDTPDNALDSANDQTHKGNDL